MNSSPIPHERLGPLAGRVDDALADLVRRDAVARLWAVDHTLWDPDPTEIADRIGWLAVLDDMVAARERIDAFVAAAHADGLTHAVVMGMGGSSLFPR